jgi:probable addiction module antidote protein
MARVSRFDAADYLRTPEAITVYLAEAFGTSDDAYICTALDTIARAKEMTGPWKDHFPSAS